MIKFVLYGIFQVYLLTCESYDMFIPNPSPRVAVSYIIQVHTMDNIQALTRNNINPAEAPTIESRSGNMASGHFTVCVVQCIS